MKKVKRLLALTIVVLMIASSLAACVDVNTTTITIATASDTLKKGDSLTIVAVASNNGDVTLSVDKNDVVELVGNVIKVKDTATLTTDVEVTITATLNDNPEVTQTKKITVKADVVKVNVVLSCSSYQINAQDSVMLSAVASDRSDIVIKATGDNANLVKIENNILTVVGEITMDTVITVVAELADDPTVKDTKLITIKGPQAGAWIKITPSTYTIKQTSDGYALINVTSHTNGAYTISLSDGKDAYYNPGNHRLFVKNDANVTENKEITVTATLTSDPTVKDTITITIVPAPVIPTITINTKDNATSLSKDKDLPLTITVSTDEAYDLTVSDSSLVEITGSAGNEKLTVIGKNTFDRTITVTATLRSDPTVKISKSFIVNAPREEGRVSGEHTEITNSMFTAMGAQSMTVSGMLTDVYKNFVEGYESNHNYDIVVKMEDGKWYGAWAALLDGSTKEIVNEETYIRGTETATINGVTGHVVKQVFVDMNNEVTQKTLVDYRSVPLLWENRHMWNHFGVDVVDNYSYRENEGTDEYEVYEFVGDKTSEEIAYYLTYLAFAYTPLVYDTFDRVYLKVDIATNKIIGMIAYTEFIYVGAESEDKGATSVSYSKVDISFTDVGSTTVPGINVYSAPDHADVLQTAINNMKAATNYTFTAIDTTTYAPSTDEGDYTLESVSVGDYVQTLSTVSKDYSAPESPLGGGAVGLQGRITADAILIKSTFKYSSSMDENVYRIENYGYYQKNDDYYDYFKYNSSIQEFEGKQQYSGSITDKLPKWNFSAYVFEYIGQGGTSSVPTYKFRLRDAAITRDVALQVSMHNYATDGSDSSERKLTIEVAVNGSYVVSTMYPYSINDIYYGYITTTYSNVGETTIPAAEFEGYSPRIVSPNWVDYSLKYYHADHISNNPYDEGTGETILKIMFGDDWVDFPPMTVFTDVFGDDVSGPFFEWDNITDVNGETIDYKDYFSLTARCDEYDENMQITYEIYKAIIDKLTQGMAKYNFSVSYETPKQDLGSRQDRYVSYMNEDLKCQIVIENNHTRNFWIYVGYLGDWSF